MSKQEEKKLAERIYSLHCRGNAISDIASILEIDEEKVRACITEAWRKDKEEGAYSWR